MSAMEFGIRKTGSFNEFSKQAPALAEARRWMSDDGRPATGLPVVNLQVDIDLLAVIELAHGLGVALAAIKLSINFVVDVGGKRWESIGAIAAYDVGLHGTSARVREIYHGID